MLASPVRRTVLLALIGMAAGLLPLVITAPVSASASCTTEQGVFPLMCDDEKPPDTVSATWTTDGTAAYVIATASYNDNGADQDTYGFQCQVADGSLDPGGWGGCTISGLSDGNHAIAVRAVDAVDHAIAACELVDCGPEVPDFDASPLTVTVTIGDGGGGGGGLPGGPNGAPETQISAGPHDKITPGAPVALTRSPQFTLASSEPATFNCAVNARKVPCQAGVNVLKRLKPGSQVLVAQAVDRDGNHDATPASFTFYVPLNLEPGQGNGWRKVKSRGAFAGDYVSTSIRGAVLTVGSVNGVREVRLIAPTGPNLGKVAVRVGHGKWKTVDLKAAKTQQLRVFVIRGPGSGLVSGVIQIRALKAPGGGAVAVDAIVAR